jgi:ribonuclease P protein component
MERLKKRRDFLSAQKGRRANTGLFSLQALPRGEGCEARCGFTVSKRVSLKAVVRNRIRRRLKEAVRTDGSKTAANAMDYVIVARLGCLAAPFALIRTELARAFVKVSRQPETTPIVRP